MAAKQARITLTIGKGSEGPRSAGDLSLLGLSFAFYQIWLHMAIFGAPKTFGSMAFLPYEFAFPQQYHSILIYTFLVASCMVLIASAIFSKRVLIYSRSKLCAILSSAFMFLGTILLFFAPAGEIAVAISGIFVGVGTAFFVILFGIVYSSFDFATCVLNSGLAFAIGFIGADAFINWIPSPFSGVIACLMPLLLPIDLIRNMPKRESNSPSGISLEYVRPYIVRLGASMAFMGIVLGALRVVCGSRLLTSGDISLELIIGGGCMTSAAVLVCAIALSKRTELWDSLLRNVTPVIMFGIATIALLVGGFKMFGAFFTIIGFSCLGSIIWILLTSLARNLNGSHVFVVGLGYGIIQASSIIGSALVNLISPQIHPENAGQGQSVDAVTSSLQLGLSDIAIALMVLFSIGYMLVPRYRELKGILSSMVLALTKRADDIHSYDASTQEAMHASDEEAQEVAHLSRTPYENDTGVVAYPQIAVEKTPGTEDANISRPSFISTDGETSPRVETFESTNAENENTRSVDRPDKKDKKGSFKRRCDELSDKYLLSAREREAFFLLAKGHNAAFLTEKLCISRSTAKTHINHIYKKMGVHTQQELLNMVEDRTRGPIIQTIDRATLQNAARKAKEEGPLESNPSKLVESIRRDII